MDSNRSTAGSIALLIALISGFGCKHGDLNHASVKDASSAADLAAFNAAVGTHTLSFGPGEKTFGSSGLAATEFTFTLNADGTYAASVSNSEQKNFRTLSGALGANDLSSQGDLYKRAAPNYSADQLFTDFLPFMDGLVAAYPETAYSRQLVKLNAQGAKVLASARKLYGSPSSLKFYGDLIGDHHFVSMQTGPNSASDPLLISVSSAALQPGASTDPVVEGGFMSNLWTLLHLANKPPAVDTKLDAISYHIYLRRPAERTDNAILWHDYLEIEYLNTARGLYDTASYGLEALPPVGSAVEAKAGAEAGKFVLAFRAMKNALGNSLYAQEDRSAQTFLDAVEAVLDQRVAAESVASASFKGAIGVATKKNAVVENMPASGADSRDAATGDGGQEGAGGNDKGGGKDAKPAGR